MADQQTQGDAGIGLSSNYNIVALIGSLMDVQQIVRTMPSIIAGAEALRAENEKLKAKLAEVEAQLAALAPSPVKVEVAE
jgi:regulator of replication initiation timing